MAIKDFFHLSEAEFADRISKLTDEELMKDDIHNCRTVHSGTYGAAIGAIEAPLTAGMSLMGTAIGIRRRHVAQRRLEMIHQELMKRGLPLHKQTKRDYLIPLGIAGLSAGISAGVMDGVMGAIPADSLADAAFDLSATTGQQVAQEATGKLAVEMGTSEASAGLAPPQMETPGSAVSAPPTPLDERPPLPPRPRSVMQLDVT
ncbi:hypothetical protein LTR56_018628 [Elasticomyces elasticus]|nr:hypothetical protein LTR56_018628 [Elasticomyces elasticus]KAK3635639.1 hypothetical protein LTR22_019066 [Elasticomyces elasticus]KAK4933083.1 hypothetical protein LTR49_000567 [Elasticomyces elasticus]KAK5763982.1 hypothetical protein LTS12_005892 [Elasticomyces elasticus]